MGTMNTPGTGGMSTEQKVALIAAKQPVFHEIDLGLYFTSKTTESYTGLSVTIPANAYYSITARTLWSNGKPDWVGISVSDTVNRQTVAEGTAPYAAATCTISGKTKEEKTFYVWAKYSNEAENKAEIRGFYITEGETQWEQ